MDVEKEVEENRQSIRSDGYAMSIGEVLNLYRDEEIKIRPEFQRLFRWPIEKQSRLIESILLDIPLPSIFVAQNEQSVWEVVDGLQRLSTILKFVGVLRDEGTGEIQEASRLSRTKYIPSLDGVTYEDLPKSVQIQFKRARLDFRILLKESGDAVKYELFDRLNSGGMRTSPQEVRTAMLIMSDPRFFGELQSLRSEQPVLDSFALSDRQMEEQYDIELLIRFMAIHESSPEDLSTFADMDTFLTDKMLELAHSENGRQDRLTRLSREVFEITSTIGSAAFRKFDSDRQKSVGGFSVSAFEAVTAGVAAHLKAWQQLDDETRRVRLRSAIAELWLDAEFQKNSGAGVRASTRAPKMPSVGARVLQVS